MLSGLMEQLQDKEEQYSEVLDRLEELDEKMDNVKRENILLRDEIREKYPTIPFHHFIFSTITVSNGFSLISKETPRLPDSQ